MKQLVQYLCQRCGYITSRKVKTCPACQDGRVAKWTTTNSNGDDDGS